MNIYHYHQDTKEYLGQSKAVKSPLDQEEVYLVPAFATKLEPLFEEGKKTFFENENWINKIIEDIKPDLEPEPTLQEIKLEKITQCKFYLNETDWYITRMIDPSSLIIVPENILINRANARAWQENINACTSLEELNAININFS